MGMGRSLDSERIKVGVGKRAGRATERTGVDVDGSNIAQLLGGGSDKSRAPVFGQPSRALPWGISSIF